MSFRSKYDIAIIGGGIGGLMTAHSLAEKAPELSICLMERGPGYPGPHLSHCSR